MIPRIGDYAQFVGKNEVEKIKDIALKLEGKRIAHVNSAYSGGGVAEILNSLIVLTNKLGIEADWHLLAGSHSFFDVTKKFHNALQGEKIAISNRQRKIYLDELERNALFHHFHDEDIVFIHDPQPLGMIKFVKKRQPWIWRCHIDIKHADKLAWSYLGSFAKQYDGAIFTMRKYKRRDLEIPQFFIAPSIDPLSLKNKHLSDGEVEKILSREGISTSKPIITQVSRFDKWKNPIGVLEIFRRVREREGASLVLIGDMASDDPEGPGVYSRVVEQAKKMEDVHIITKKDDMLVNALQRMSHVILQNSKREGFGLTVSEALWKETPVIGTKRGGIPLQVLHGKTGALVSNSREAAEWCVKLLRDENLRLRMGREGKEHVRKNFLLPRQLFDYLKITEYYTATIADDFAKVGRMMKGMLLRPST
ncbi:MAG TPA: glycosyltransferase [Candidatus Nanoarchaeia archaeon]|nr:glycosyltransferase [Candidatus Nanoarchaeia archaeon]